MIFNKPVRLYLLTLAVVYTWTISADAQHNKPYTKQNYEHGKLIAGKPVGVWEYYDGDQLGLVINYDSGRIRYIRPDTTRYSVWLDSAWQAKRLGQAPRLIGSRSGTIIALQKVLRYPPADLRTGQTGHVVVSCIVFENGQVSEPTVLTAPSPSLGEEVRRAVADLSLRYLPGLYRGRAVRTQIAFLATFCIRRGSTTSTGCPTDQISINGGFTQILVTAL